MAPSLFTETPTHSAAGVPQPPNLPPELPLSPVCTLDKSSTPPGRGGTFKWKHLGKFAKALNVVGPIKTVADELIECTRIYENVSNNQKDYNTLQSELESLFEELEKNLSLDVAPVMTTSIKNLCATIRAELLFIQSKQNKHGLKRAIEAGEDSEVVLACYRRVQGNLQRLLLNVNLSSWKVVDELAAENRLGKLSLALSARYNSAQALDIERGECTPGTRIGIFESISKWMDSPVSGLIFWLNGMAGTGKTTIAYSLCARLSASHRLAASFFCTRALPECRNVCFIIPSLAYQLARFSTPFRFELLRVLEENPDAHTSLPHAQFDMLISRPLAHARNPWPPNSIVVIDALDECDNKEGTRTILDILLTRTQNLPIKFFISSRPEPAIRNPMAEPNRNDRLVLHELEKNVVQEDIRTYLRTALAPINPSDQQIMTLVERAGILFIYAATAIRFILCGKLGQIARSRRRLEVVLNMSSSSRNKYKEIDDLYTVILKEAFDDPNLDDLEKEDMKLVLYAVICAREPLTIQALASLLKMNDDDRVDAALSLLWSVLHVTETGKPVTVLHASFPDYLFDQTRSKEYYCDHGMHHRILAGLCFELVREVKPQFNISELKSSYIRDNDIKHLDEQTNKVISTELFYACQYWAVHLNASKNSPELIAQLRHFLTRNLLLWIEVMNLKKSMHKSVEAMHMAETWIKSLEHSDDDLNLAHDAWRFATTIASNPINQSTLHIYESALPFWPRHNPIARYYAERASRITSFRGTSMDQQEPLLAQWKLIGNVETAAFSPDGTQITLSIGTAVHILDAFSGRRLLDTFSSQRFPLSSGGHTMRIRSLTFSPDGVHIASSSLDETICIWDARSGQLQATLHSPQGYGRATSISFSPNGAFVASGSQKDIHVWDIREHPVLYRDFKSVHVIKSVEYSPDGTQIVSLAYGSSSIQVWCAESGKLMLTLGDRYSGFVSVGYSPNGDHIVSGSNDSKICAWDARRGQIVLGPLKIGRINCSIESVQYSSDGTRIAAAANTIINEGSVYLFDARNGEMLVGPLESQNNGLGFIRFSPDCTRILSGGPNDSNVWIWDAQSKGRIDKTSNGHAHWVTSVGYSPDGAHIVSGSYDGSVCVWNVQTGELELGPPREHNEPIDSVKYSSDGTYIFSESKNNNTCIWDSRSGQRTGLNLYAHERTALARCDAEVASVSASQYHVRTSISVGYLPIGTQISSELNSNHRILRIWDSRNERTVLRSFVGHTAPIRSVDFSPDGSRIASGSDDKTILVWNSQNGKMAAKLVGHTDSVNSARYSPDGTLIASGSNDRTICIWNASTGDLIVGPLIGHTNRVSSISFSPEGSHIVSGSYDKTIRVWNIKDTYTNEINMSNKYQWKINEDGWIVDRCDRLLAWVPPHLRTSLIIPRNELIITKQPHVRVVFAHCGN